MSLPGNASGWLEDYVNPVTGAAPSGSGAGRRTRTDRRDPAVARGQVLLPPEQDNYRYFNDPAHPELGRSWDPVGDGEHRPASLRVADRHPAQLVGPRPLRCSHAQPDISVWELAQAQNRRVLGWHVKDGFGTPRKPAPGSAARRRAERHASRRSRARRRTDARHLGRGDLGAGPGLATNADPDCRASSSCSRTWAVPSAST